MGRSAIMRLPKTPHLGGAHDGIPWEAFESLRKMQESEIKSKSQLRLLPFAKIRVEIEHGSSATSVRKAVAPVLELLYHVPATEIHNSSEFGTKANLLRGKLCKVHLNPSQNLYPCRSTSKLEMHFLPTTSPRDAGIS